MSFISPKCNFLWDLGQQRKCNRSFLYVSSDLFSIDRYVDVQVTLDNASVSASLLIANIPHEVI